MVVLAPAMLLSYSSSFENIGGFQDRTDTSDLARMLLSPRTRKIHSATVIRIWHCGPSFGPGVGAPGPVMLAMLRAPSSPLPGLVQGLAHTPARMAPGRVLRADRWLAGIPVELPVISSLLPPFLPSLGLKGRTRCHGFHGRSPQPMIPPRLVKL